jgi:hypothetical protein
VEPTRHDDHRRPRRGRRAFRRAALDTGIDGVTVNSPPNGHIEGRVALLGETLAPAFAR